MARKSSKVERASELDEHPAPSMGQGDSFYEAKTAAPHVPVFVGDAAAALYKDKSGPPRGLPISEGKDNFGAITAEAHKSVALAQSEDRAHAR